MGTTNGRRRSEERDATVANIAVVRGVLAGMPQDRTLASGDATELTVRIAGADGRPTEMVPVLWPEPPARAADLAEGTEVVVVGRVRRRFYRSASGTRSTTEVVADDVVPARRAAAARRLIERAAAEMATVLP